MYSLLLDMSLPGFRFAIIDQASQSVVRFESSDRVRESAKEFPSVVQNSFAETKILPSQINEIFIGSGPGSFTGMRMSLAYSLGLLSAHSPGSVKWHGFSALELLGQSVKSRSNQQAALVILPSTRSAGFVWHSSKINDFSEYEKSMTLDELLTLVKSFKVEVGGPVLMLGKWPEFESMMSDLLCEIDVNNEFRLALEYCLTTRMQDRQFFSSSSSFHPPELRYHRKSSAEEKRDQISQG